MWFTTDGIEWQEVLSPLPWLSRQGAGLVVSGDTMYLVGRLNDDTTVGPNDLWYTNDGESWHKTAVNPPWLGREDHGALLFADRLWVLGGMDINWRWRNDVWKSSLLSAVEPSGPPQLSAQAAVSVLVEQNGETRVLLSQNAERELPIASMSKLMTALVAQDSFALTDMVEVTPAVLAGKGTSGTYASGETFYIKDALRALLVASHNEIASALANKAGADTFVRAMNERAQTLGLKHTHFTNASGLDPSASETPNHGSATDIYKLLRYIYETEPELFSTLATASYELKTGSGAFKTTLKTTNKLLGADAALVVLGGKTGETPRAKQNLALVAQLPTGAVVISVVIGSTNSFSDMRAVLQYAKDMTGQ